MTLLSMERHTSNFLSQLPSIKKLAFEIFRQELDFDKKYIFFVVCEAIQSTAWSGTWKGKETKFLATTSCHETMKNVKYNNALSDAAVERNVFPFTSF